MAIDIPQQRQPEGERQLNEADALAYLSDIRNQFEDHEYDQFLNIMRDFIDEAIDTLGVIRRVSRLFCEHPTFIARFNAFLPVGYRIDVYVGPLDPTVIRVTTPSGRTTYITL